MFINKYKKFQTVEGNPLLLSLAIIPNLYPAEVV